MDYAITTPNIGSVLRTNPPHPDSNPYLTMSSTSRNTPITNTKLTNPAASGKPIVRLTRKEQIVNEVIFMTTVLAAVALLLYHYVWIFSHFVGEEAVDPKSAFKLYGGFFANLAVCCGFLQLSYRKFYAKVFEDEMLREEIEEEEMKRNQTKKEQIKETTKDK